MNDLEKIPTEQLVEEQVMEISPLRVLKVIQELR